MAQFKKYIEYEGHIYGVTHEEETKFWAWRLTKNLEKDKRFPYSRTIHKNKPYKELEVTNA